MKINLAILSSDKRTIDLVNELDLQNICNLYANCSRNVDIAENFSKEYGFSKYYGSYEELIQDNNINIVLNLLPSGIKFEYTYLCLKKGLKVICDYSIIKSINEIKSYQEIIDNKLINNLFLIDNLCFKNFYNKTINKKKIFYLKRFNKDFDKDNSLVNKDFLYELTPDLFFFLNQFKKNQIRIEVLDIERDKITKNINYFNCLIDINSDMKVHVLLNYSEDSNITYNFELNNSNEINTFVHNKKDLLNFIIGKKPFDNLSEFQYYPFKLFQEVLNE